MTKQAFIRATRLQRSIDDQKPLLIAIGGLSGTGKSTIARALACQVAKPPGAIVIPSASAAHSHSSGIP